MKFKKTIKNNPFTVLTVLLALVMCAFTFMYSVYVALVELAAIIFITALALRWYSNATARKKTEIRLLSDSLKTDKLMGSELEALPFAVVLCENDGSIVWFNNLFEKLIPDMEAKAQTEVGELIKGFVTKKNESVFEFSGNERKFTVYRSTLNDGLTAFYFTDDTNLKDIRTRFQLTRPVVLIVNVDSLEQAEDLMPHEEYYGLNSDIDRLISKWFVENNCVFRKFSDGKFFALTEISNLSVMTAKRFDIIDKVRQAHFGSEEVDITLSIGVGHEDDLRAGENSARQALDMARGRGGDQVAVKDGDNYEFFGGISSGKEKRGKVKSRAFAAALDGYIETGSDLLIMGHSFSDFDCIGAAAGIAAIAKAKGKSAKIVVDKSTSMALSMIEMLEASSSGVSFVSPEEAINYVTDTTLLVITDTMRLKIVEAPELVNMGLRTVIIDHHRMTVDHIDGNTFEFLEPHASSACEMVTELVQYSPSKPKLSVSQAQALLAGIILDTKNFTLRVSVRTFEAASYLKNCKADTVATKKLFSGSASENIQINNTVNSAVYYDRYAISVCTETGRDSRLVAAKAADELLGISGVDASFVICENGDSVNISARSLERLNVQLIMEKLGGGGHHSMAAAQLKGVTVAQASAVLREAVDGYIKSL